MSGPEQAALRPVLDERRAYVPRARQERFIVPLLNSAILRALDTYAREGAGRWAIDIGCGGQPFRKELQRRGWAYCAMDTQSQPGVTTDFIAPIDAELPANLRQRAGSFHLVLCTEVLEHVADWHAAFANIADLLAPGGRAIVTCPHVYPLHEEPYDFWRPTQHALREFAQRAGLHVVAHERLGGAWEVIGTVLAASAPASGGLGPLGVLAAAIARPLRSLAVWTIATGLPARLIKPKGSVHLSNLIVLERGLGA